VLRRAFRTAAVLSLLVLAAGTALRGQAGEPAPARPNVLFITVDDLRPLLGCYGDTDVVSPNIDRLAAAGVTFLNASCQWPVCGPSRASLLTGLRPESCGVMGLTTQLRKVRPDVLTLPQYFRQNGYTTAAVGKIFDPRTVDDRDGCDEPSWSLPCVFEPESTLDEKWMEAEKLNKLQGKHAAYAFDFPDEAFPDGRVARYGLEQLRRLAREDAPFFLALGFMKPHLPLVAPSRYWELYERDEIALAPQQARAASRSGLAFDGSSELRKHDGMPADGVLTDEQQRLVIHGYMACVSWVDALIGRFLDELEALGVRDETIVVLLGDHGFHLGEHGQWAKRTLLEEGVRVPLIVADPRSSVAGRTTAAAAELTDVFPTLCDLVGLERPSALDGVSLAPTLADPLTESRRGATALYAIGDVYGYSFRTPRYRYVEWIQRETLELVGRDLYDFEANPSGGRNVASEEEYAATLSELARCLHADTRGWTVLDAYVAGD
jgi:arylsulfatase A-like enzyme